ncbi:hypothetical protein CPSG_00293 [Coccidioides posadasii str. Silveira]|uniref:Uncharacterized protein n=1 Tax=Coccidioides posadasii (strain RMSCC 757 / Silveira) TaxID=443226 RepID=E9CRB3_COCPS|nr:hypothetical protein CPSG_00293 [Coccidioides posadasii str. Silveira]
MKLTTSAFLLSILAASVASTPSLHIEAQPGFVYSRASNECSGYRLPNERCQGKLLASNTNDYIDCQEKRGKCCAMDASGTGGYSINPDKFVGGNGRYDGGCGHCFDGECAGRAYQRWISMGKQMRVFLIYDWGTQIFVARVYGIIGHQCVEA